MERKRKYIRTIAKLISPEMQDEMVTLRRHGVTLKDMSEHYNIKIATISAAIRDLQKPVGRVALALEKLDSQLENVLCDYYWTDLTLGGLAEKYEVNPAVMRLLFDKYGVPSKPRPTPKTPANTLKNLPNEELVFMKEWGFSYVEIGKLYGIGMMTARRHIMRHNPNPRLLATKVRKSRRTSPVFVDNFMEGVYANEPK